MKSRILFFIAIIFVFTFQSVYAGVERVFLGQTIRIGDFVFEDDYSPSTDDCTISIFNPSGVQKVNEATMLDNVSGWHYYDYTVPSNEEIGKWPVIMSCGSNLTLDLVRVNKDFVVEIDTSLSTSTIASSVSESVWSNPLRSLTDYATSSIAAAIWGSTNRTLTSFGSLVSDIWANGTKELTSYGNDITAADVWSVLTSNLTTINSIGKLLADNVDTRVSTRANLSNQEAGWTVNMSDFTTVQTGKTYRAKVSILNNQSIQTNPLSTPTITLYDPSRNIVVSNIPMTFISSGIYEYTYTVAGAAEQGVWEGIVSTQVESGKTITTNDYWLVAGSPAQVIINSVSGTIPTATANLTITNEGLTGYEYQYEWCVVSDINNACGGGDDVYRGTGAKFINPGEDWNTNLTATINTPGDYYYKVIVYFGTEKSGSSRTFSINSGSTVVTPPSGSGGGISSSGNVVAVCVGADLNGDKKVNTVDFSILLSFWKTKAPFKNTCVDISKDGNVNTVDFSILLSQWGSKGKAINTK